MRWRIGLALLLVVPLLVSPLVTGLPHLPGTPVTGTAQLSGLSAEPGLKWGPCQADWAKPFLKKPAAKRLQCATTFVPLDWNHPRGTQIPLAVSRLLSTRQPARGALFLNPGGPGFPGLSMPASFLREPVPALSAERDLYGFNVRGAVTTSCGEQPPTPDVADRSEANLARLGRYYADYAAGCARAGGENARFITTQNTARDLFRLRELIGMPRVDWLGYSAASRLGATYATLFPEHTGRLVFDSSLDFTLTWQRGFAAQARSYQEAFDREFTPDEATQVQQLRADLAQHRLSDGFGPEEFDRMLEAGLRAGPTNELPSQLRSLRERWDAEQTGNAEQAGDSKGAAEQTLTGGPSYEAAWLTVLCNDDPVQGSAAQMMAWNTALGKKLPVHGYRDATAVCHWWPRKPAPQLALTGKGLPGSLFVSGDQDPAAPLRAAQAAASKFEGSHLLTVRNQSRHGQFHSGNSCVDDAVVAFLLSGDLPEGSC